MAKNWQHRDVWTRQTQHFTVQVERREVEQADSAFEVLGPNRWNVYAYIHDGDARYTHHATPADGIKQFRDADELFAWLERARISVEK